MYIGTNTTRVIEKDRYGAQKHMERKSEEIGGMKRGARGRRTDT